MSDYVLHKFKLIKLEIFKKCTSRKGGSKNRSLISCISLVCEGATDAQVKRALREYVN